MRPPDSDEDCVFCSIAKGEEASVEVVARGSEWIAFFPLDPATPGHTLVIPRAHVANLWKAGQATAMTLIKAVIGVGIAIDEALSPEGMNLVTSAGETAEQTVFHLHLHVVPRWRRDGFGRIWPSEERYYTEARIEDVAERVRIAYAQQKAT